MRLLSLGLALCLTFPVTLAALACGGGAPPAKTAEDEPKADAKAADAGPPAADSAPAASAAPAAAPAPTPAPAPAPAPPAEDEVWQAFHQMPSNDILKTTRANQGKVQACIHEGLKRDSSEAGEVKIKFVVNQKGEVLAWKDDTSSMSDEDTVKCIGEAIKKMKFPAQKMTGNTVATYSVHVSG